MPVEGTCFKPFRGEAAFQKFAHCGGAAGHAHLISKIIQDDPFVPSEDDLVGRTCQTARVADTPAKTT
jgi:hypothetical protein